MPGNATVWSRGWQDATEGLDRVEQHSPGWPSACDIVTAILLEGDNMRERIILGLFVLGLPLYGQQATARIMGTVFDPSSAVIAGAAVTVTSVATSQQRSAVTSSSGEY